MAKHVIWHLGQWSNNYGSMAIQRAFKDSLKERTTDNLEFVYLDADKVVVSRDLVAKMNAEADLLLIGSGALILNRPDNITGWQLNLQEDALEDINIPIAVYGIGMGLLDNYDAFDMPKVESSLDKLKAKSGFFSFRTPNAAEMFEHIIEDDLVSPDISMFAPTKSNITNPFLNTDKLKIGLSWPTDNWDKRFGSYAKGKEYLEAVLRALKPITETYNSKVFIIEHSEKSNLNLTGKNILRDFVLSMLGEDNSIFVFDHAPEFWPPQEIYAGFLGDIYDKMDFVLSGRAVSCMESFGKGTPFIALGPNTKIKNIVSYIVGLNYYINLKTADAGSLEKVIVDKISSSDDIKDHLTSQKAIFNQIKNNHLDDILSLL